MTTPPARRVGAAVLATVAAALTLGACGASDTAHITVRSGSAVPPSTSATPPTSVPPATTTVPAVAVCAAGGLRADQAPLSEGTSQYYLAWSLTNTGSKACRLAPGQPALQLDDAAGRSVTTYRVTSLGGGSAAALTVAPGQAAWFLTEESADNCSPGETVVGGPFHYVVALPAGGARVTWAPAYLASGSISDLCPTVALGVGDLSPTAPTAP